MMVFSQVDWTAVSSVGSLLAVLAALALSIVPALSRRHRTKAQARVHVKNTFSLINTYLENYRFFHVTHTIINGEIYRSFVSKAAGYDLQINPAAVLEGIRDEVRLISNPRLLNMYDTSVAIFSGWPEKLIRWYELEALICLHYALDVANKKYFRYELDTINPEDPPADAKRVYRCIVCTEDFAYGGELSGPQTDALSRVFQTRLCPKHSVPMHISFKRQSQ
jgi:hypothetical protein